MTVRTTALGGTDWSDGENCTHTDLNDTFNAVTIHTDVFNDNTERTTGNATMTDTATAFTLTTSATALILSVKMDCEMKASANTSYARLKFTGSTLTTFYTGSSNCLNIGADAAYRVPFFGPDATGLGLVHGTTNTSYERSVSVCADTAALADTTTTLTVQIYNTGGTASIRNVTVTVTWVEAYKAD